MGQGGRKVKMIEWTAYVMYEKKEGKHIKLGQGVLEN